VTAGTIGRPWGSSFHGDGRSGEALPASSPRLPGCSQGLGPCGFRPEREPSGSGYQAARLPELSVVRPDPEAAGVYDRSVSGPISCRPALWLVRRYLRRPHSRLPGSWRDKDSVAFERVVGTGTVLARRRAVDAISSCGDVELILTAARHRRSARSPRPIIRRGRCALRATTVRPQPHDPCSMPNAHGDRARAWSPGPRQRR
jgi:hypothetical protein